MGFLGGSLQALLGKKVPLENSSVAPTMHGDGVILVGTSYPTKMLLTQSEKQLPREEHTENIRELMRLLAWQKSIAVATKKHGQAESTISEDKSKISN